jgi:hypothetical protein
VDLYTRKELAGRWQQIKGAVIIAALVALLCLVAPGCKSIKGASDTRQYTDPSTTSHTTGATAINTDVQAMMAWFDAMGKVRVAYWLDARQASTTQPTISTVTTGRTESTTHTGPIVTGTSNVTMDGNKVETKQEAKDYGWIYPAAGVLCLLLAGVAGWMKQYKAAAIVAGIAVVLMSWTWLGPWVAVMLGICFVLTVLYGVYAVIEGQWNKSLPGVAKLVQEGKNEEAMAALRASTPELDQAFVENGLQARLTRRVK